MATQKSSTGDQKGTTGAKRMASAWLDEVENASETVLKEVRSSLNAISGKISTTAEAASEATSAFTEHMSGAEVTQRMRSLLSDVEELGEGLMRFLGGRLEALRGQLAVAKLPSVRKKAGKKRGAKKKAATGKKRAAGKKATAKKSTAKKGAAKKRSAKKSGARKKSAGAARKKKASGRKVAARKKSAVTKKAAGKKRARAAGRGKKKR